MIDLTIFKACDLFFCYSLDLISIFIGVGIGVLFSVWLFWDKLKQMNIKHNLNSIHWTYNFSYWFF